MRRVIQVEERPPLKEALPLGFQHLFAMFGASVLVPSIFGINPAIVLFMNGLGTLLFMFLTKGKAPAFLGSSFSFISPALIIIANQSLGYPYALGGFVISGLLFCVFALIIGKFGSDWIQFVLPPAAMGPVIALIGLELAGVAAQTGGVLIQEGVAMDMRYVLVFVATLAVMIFGSVLFRGFFAVIPILIAIVFGYVLSLIVGIVDFSALEGAALFALPNFQLPQFNLDAILIIMPATLVVLSEHIGHQLVTSKVVGRDLIKDPGLHRSMLGDGLSTAISGMLGSVPTTTYGENIGVMAITKVYSVWVIGLAAVISIVFSFIGVVSAAIQTIPGPVMGAVSFVLYGMIAVSGIRLLVESNVDYSKSKNLMLTSVVLIVGLSGIAVQLGNVQLRGMALATVVGMILSLIFFLIEKFNLVNEN